MFDVTVMIGEEGDARCYSLRSKLNRLGDVGGLDFFGGGEIGDGAADFEYPAVGASAQAQVVDCGFEQSFRVVIHSAITFDISRAHLDVGMHVSFVKPLQLNRPRIIDPLADELRGFAAVNHTFLYLYPRDT